MVSCRDRCGDHLGDTLSIDRFYDETPLGLNSAVDQRVARTVFMPVFIRDLARDVDVFKLLPTNEQWLVAAIGLTSTLGAVLLYLSVNSKNATLARLIEITYPVFVVLFAYLFFRQVHVNTSVILGGLMILVGAGLVIYNNQ